MALIRGIVVPPEDKPYLIEIDNRSIRKYQDVVGGYLEMICGDIATVYVNEEADHNGSLYNTSISLFPGLTLCGTALVVGPAGDDGYDTDVHPSVVEYYTEEMEK